jgi:hypothetical protein
VAVAWIALFPAAGWAALCGSLSGAADVSENFEFINTSPAGGQSFTLGPPGSALFEGQQFSGVVGDLELYHGGLHAWMVLPNGLGTITFDPPASEVLFFAKTRSTAAGNTVIDSLGPGDNLIDTVVLPAGMAFGVWEEVCLTGSIAALEFTNNDAIAMNAMDDFSYIVPEPSAAFSTGAGLASLLGVASLRRRRRGAVS